MDMGLFGLGEPKKMDEWQQVTHTPERTDWTHFLSPEASSLLRSMLEAAYNHRDAYFRADDIKNAQLWSAIIELKRQINDLNEKIENMRPKETHREFKLGTAQDSVVLNKIRAMMQPTVEDSKEAKDALVNSLMKF